MVWDAEVRRGPSSAVLAGVLERRMFRELRQEGGLSYTVRAGYEPRSDGTALITAVADSLPEKVPAVLGGMVDLLAVLETGRITADEVTAVFEQASDELAQAAERGLRLPGQVMNLLSDRPVQDVEEALAELWAVTPESVAEAGIAAYRSGLLITPGGLGAAWAGYEEAPDRSDDAITGTSFRARRAVGTRLVVGDEGVSVTGPDGPATVRFDECVAMLVWPDGGRRLFGPDGIVVVAEPAHFRGADTAIRDLHQRVPEHVRVVMPVRDPGQIPPAPYGSVPPRIWSPRWWRLTFAAVRAARGRDLNIVLGMVVFPLFTLLAPQRAFTGANLRDSIIISGLIVCSAGSYWFSRPYLRRTRGW